MYQGVHLCIVFLQGDAQCQVEEFIFIKSFLFITYLDNDNIVFFRQ